MRASASNRGGRAWTSGRRPTTPDRWLSFERAVRVARGRYRRQTRLNIEHADRMGLIAMAGKDSNIVTELMTKQSTRTEADLRLQLEHLCRVKANILQALCTENRPLRV